VRYLGGDAAHHLALLNIPDKNYQMTRFSPKETVVVAARKVNSGHRRQKDDLQKYRPGLTCPASELSTC
jgi:hypothetical protein